MAFFFNPIFAVRTAPLVALTSTRPPLLTSTPLWQILKRWSANWSQQLWLEQLLCQESSQKRLCGQCQNWTSNLLSSPLAIRQGKFKFFLYRKCDLVEPISSFWKQNLTFVAKLSAQRSRLTPGVRDDASLLPAPPFQHSVVSDGPMSQDRATTLTSSLASPSE